ncbi:hypothetical protein E2C01_027146 [Portunus trituberculatus]|uniref:Uncharacterized protein n=1 Tax=Portunus trituberculatus TaxID=210409 RepID=A0A5B7EMZ8_PORTR|nr:hypothetical protein [Portunus trituberculatus]
MNSTTSVFFTWAKLTERLACPQALESGEVVNRGRDEPVCTVGPCWSQDWRKCRVGKDLSVKG